MKVQDVLDVSSKKTQRFFSIKTWKKLSPGQKKKKRLLLLPLRDTTKYYVLQH